MPQRHSFDTYKEEIERGSVQHVLGADEAGTGSWAGPLIVCAAVVSVDWRGPEGLNDSKKLTRKKREALYPILQEQVTYSYAFSSSEEIDKRGLTGALVEAYHHAMTPLLQRYPGALVVIDGARLFTSVPHLRFPKADGLVPAVMAASILGKVTRDREMGEYALLYPGYDFAASVGYGVTKHQRGLAKLGICSIHRRSYAPIRKLLL